MGNLEEASAAFRRSIELHPDYIESYAALVEIFTGEGQISEAREVLEQGIRANPDSAQLLTILASTYLDTDLVYAEELLEEAEEIDPDSEVVRLFRQVLNISKLEKRSQQKQLPRGKKRRKR
jgi:tetratricopeptide (TPR) repeat protein